MPPEKPMNPADMGKWLHFLFSLSELPIYVSLMRYHAHFLHTNKRDRQWVEGASQKLAQNKVKILMILNICKKKISEIRRQIELRRQTYASHQRLAAVCAWAS
jgi:hypothetical protein